MVAKIAMIGSGSGKLARRKDDALAPANNLSLAVTGQALVRQLVYDVEMIGHLETADKAGSLDYHGYGSWRLDAAKRHDGHLHDAKPYHFRHLPLAERADAADRFLHGIIIPLGRVTHEQATAMLTYLFGAKGRRRDDEAAIKLAACIDIFHPASNALANTLELWSEVPGHPLILALAIKDLMANKIYEPEEAELREALTKVYDRIRGRHGSIRRWFRRLNNADKLVFEFDRPAWEQAYARVNSAVVRTMLPFNDEGYVDEDDGTVVPPTERWQALHDLLEAKQAAEKTALPPTPEEQKKTAAMLYLAGTPASPSERISRKGDDR